MVPDSWAWLPKEAQAYFLGKPTEIIAVVKEMWTVPRKVNEVNEGYQMDGSRTGRRVSGTDSAAKAIELAKYTDDVILPGMLRGETLRSLHPHTRIMSMSTHRAVGLPGVRAVGYQQGHNRHKVWIMETHYGSVSLPIHKVCCVGPDVAAVTAISQV